MSPLLNTLVVIVFLLLGYALTEEIEVDEKGCAERFLPEQVDIIHRELVQKLAYIKGWNITKLCTITHDDKHEDHEHEHGHPHAHHHGHEKPKKNKKKKKKRAATGEEPVDYHVFSPEQLEAPFDATIFPELSGAALNGSEVIHQRLRELSVRGWPTFRKLLNSKKGKGLYGPQSQILQRDARWERVVFCMRWFAYQMQRRLANPEDLKLETSKVVVLYQPMTVMMRKDVKGKVIELYKLKKDIADLVQKMPDNAFLNQSQVEEMNKKTEQVFKLTNEIAKLENDADVHSSSMQLDVSLTFQMVYAEKKTCVEENITIKSCDKNWHLPFGQDELGDVKDRHHHAKKVAQL